MSLLWVICDWFSSGFRWSVSFKEPLTNSCFNAVDLNPVPVAPSILQPQPFPGTGLRTSVLVQLLIDRNSWSLLSGITSGQSNVYTTNAMWSHAFLNIQYVPVFNAANQIRCLDVHFICYSISHFSKHLIRAKKNSLCHLLLMKYVLLCITHVKAFYFSNKTFRHVPITANHYLLSYL